MGREHFVCRRGVAAKVGEDGIYENWPSPLATAPECAWPTLGSSRGFFG
jgi:hypothetical protein